MTTSSSFLRVIAELSAEYDAAKAKHPRSAPIPFTTTDPDAAEFGLTLARDCLAEQVRNGYVDHETIIACELREAGAATDPRERRVELIQVMACCARAIDDLDVEIGGAP